MKSKHLEHTDVLRITGQSHSSFDDAISSALQQLACPSHGHHHHPGLIFESFEVVKLSGEIEHDKEKKTCMIVHFKATIDVEGVHVHDVDNRE